MSEETKGIYKKIAKVMEEVEYLAKDDSIAYKDVKYKGLSEEKVTRIIRDKLVKYGVIVYPVKQDHRREGTLSTVDTTYRFVDIEDGSYIESVSSGTGSDTQDKGVGKAMTYSFKYLFLRTFAIPTGEDPDKISSAELDDRQKGENVRKGKHDILQLLEDNQDLDQDYTNGIRMDVDTAVGKEDVETLRTIYKDVKDTLRKMHAPERRDKTRRSMDEAAKQYANAKKYGEEPPLPDSKPNDEELF